MFGNRRCAGLIRATRIAAPRIPNELVGECALAASLPDMLRERHGIWIIGRQSRRPGYVLGPERATGAHRVDPTPSELSSASTAVTPRQFRLGQLDRDPRTGGLHGPHLVFQDALQVRVRREDDCRRLIETRQCDPHPPRDSLGVQTADSGGVVTSKAWAVSGTRGTTIVTSLATICPGTNCMSLWYQTGNRSCP